MKFNIRHLMFSIFLVAAILTAGRMALRDPVAEAVRTYTRLGGQFVEIHANNMATGIYHFADLSEVKKSDFDISLLNLIDPMTVDLSNSDWCDDDLHLLDGSTARKIDLRNTSVTSGAAQRLSGALGSDTEVLIGRNVAANAR